MSDGPDPPVDELATARPDQVRVGRADGSLLERARGPVIRVLVDRSYLESCTVPGADGTPLHATVSAGCAVIDPADPTRESLIGRADVALFMAKEAGRNQVVAAAQDVARSLQQGRTAT
jgi:GGDEF domain-containing protein